MQFEDITKPEKRKTNMHDTEHHIKTTLGPPDFCRPRRLAPEKLKAAKMEFDLLLKEGIIQTRSE